MYVRKIKLGDDVLLLPDSTEALATKADYEEASFHPSFLNASGVKQTFDQVNGYYKRIGKLCYIFISAQTSSDVSVHFINDLPFIPNTNIYGRIEEKGTVFANGGGCLLNVPRSLGPIKLESIITGNLLVEGIYSI